MTGTTHLAPSVRQRVGRRLRASGGGTVIAASLLLVIALMSVFAPLVAPYDPLAVDLLAAGSGPSAAHWLGTDAVGRDLLSRLLYGGQLTLLVPLLVSLISGVVGTALALVAAWAGGIVDVVISRLFDLAFAFPGILLAILAAAVFGPGLPTMIVALSVSYVPYIGRIVRSEAVRQRSLPFISAAVLQGSPGPAVVLRHILPNVAPLLLAQLTLCFGYSLTDAAALSFLGLGVQPPAADWGQMVAEGQPGLIGCQPEQSLWAGALIVLSVLAVTIVGNHLADRFDGSSRS